MPRRPGQPRSCWPAAVTAAAAITLGRPGRLARADPPTTAPAPLLQQLSDETQQMYAHARLGMVRVRLPTPPWLVRQNQLLLNKWGAQLDPSVREQILEAQDHSPTEQDRAATTAPTGLTAVGAPAGGRVLVATGLLIDPAGHAVLPLYVDRADVGEGGTLLALTGDGQRTEAAFVGSDRITNLTVLKLKDLGGGHPARFAPPTDGDPSAGRPADGSLAMVVAPDGSAHLTVWTAASADVGLVLRPDGTFAGFGFADDFLPIATARPIIDQLTADGTVRRPHLGVTGVPIRQADLFDPDAPGGPAAIRVTAVDPGSLADRAGLRPADVVLAVAGQSVGPRTIAAVIANRRGATLIRVRRGAQTLDLTVDLRLD